MFKAAVIAALGSCTAFLVSVPAQAQVVTSYYAPYTAYSVPTVAPAVVAPAVAASPLVGTLPVRTGLFGLRTAHVPVYGTAPVATVSAVAVPTYSAAMPAYSAAMPAVPTYSAAMPAVSTYSAAMPAVPAYSAAMPAYTSALPAYSAAMPSYAAARPVVTASPSSSGVAVPSTVYQSGYRGYSSYYGAAPAPLTVPSALGVSPVVVPVNTFYPTAVMSMQ